MCTKISITAISSICVIVQLEIYHFRFLLENLTYLVHCRRHYKLSTTFRDNCTPLYFLLFGKTTRWKHCRVNRSQRETRVSLRHRRETRNLENEDLQNHVGTCMWKGIRWKIFLLCALEIALCHLSTVLIEASLDIYKGNRMPFVTNRGTFRLKYCKNSRIWKNRRINLLPRNDVILHISLKWYFSGKIAGWKISRRPRGKRSPWLVWNSTPWIRLGAQFHARRGNECFLSQCTIY